MKSSPNTELTYITTIYIADDIDEAWESFIKTDKYNPDLHYIITVQLDHNYDLGFDYASSNYEIYQILCY